MSEGNVRGALTDVRGALTKGATGSRHGEPAGRLAGFLIDSQA